MMIGGFEAASYKYVLCQQYKVTLSILQQVHHHMYLCGTGFLKRKSTC
ncbi:hypothetical protein Hanom_Chr07g00610011 [Helianthus anomalus]